MTNTYKGPARTYLFVPGDRPDRFAKALTSGADMVIIDLEDAVAPTNKEQARQSVANYSFAAHSICLRINGTATAWYADDQKLCALPGVNSVMLPKVESASQVQRLAASVPAAIPILPFIETAQGYWHIQEIAAVNRVQRLVFGTLDFLLDLGMSATGDELNSVRLQMVIASRVAGIAPPVDGVTQDIKDLEGLKSDSLRARRLGFGGKTCIHPSQIEIVNTCFSYTEAELTWARKVVDAAAAARGAVISLDGKMIDRPVIERARVMLDQSRGNINDQINVPDTATNSSSSR